MKNRSLIARGRALNAMAAAAMLVLSTGVSALGLGRVNVQSVLGEALRAEIEVTSLNPDEASSLRVSLASPDAFKASGVEYNSVLQGASITLSRRADGRPVLVLQSDRVVQEPFVDVIVDFQWSTGRLTRSYTLLIDPPGRNAGAQPGSTAVAPVFSSPTPRYAPPPAPAPQAAALPPAPAPAPASPRVAPAPEPAPAPVARAPRQSARHAPPAAESEAAPSGKSIRVRPGDTLTGIAAANVQPGISLDQMLVSLYRNNPQAFVGDNMNRMRSGVTLAVPSAEAAKQLSPEEAHQVIQAQSADFSSYRHRLAGGVATVQTEEGQRQASGKIEAQIHDQKTASAPPAPDKLTLSRGAAKPGAATPEARISRETQQKAEAARVAELARNVTELKKLAGTPAAAPSAPGKATTAPLAGALPHPAAPAPASAPAPTPAPAPAPAASKPAPAPLPAPIAAAFGIKSPASAPAPVASAPAAAASPALPASAPVVAASAPAPVAAPAVAPSAPASAPARPAPASQPAEEGLLSTITDSPYLLPGVGLLVVLLGGLAFWRKRRGGGKFSSETSFMESKIQPDSFFGASGGQRVDTRDGANSSSASSSLNYSLSQLDAIGDVDPVAEADVYLAYGRDLQAEEILKEAQRSDPERLAIRTKLLEVYAKRADLKTFEAQARQLQGLTGGRGEDWTKAQELGRQIDPANPLYQAGSEISMADTEPAPLTPLVPEDDEQTLLRPPGRPTAGAPADFGSTDLPIDFDEPATAPQSLSPSTELQDDELSADEGKPFEVSDFDFGGEPAGLASPASPHDIESAPAASPSPDFDFGDLSLDVGKSDGAGHAELDEAGLDDLPELDMPAAAESEPMARKIELADEFRRIGDHEGARELLEEVVSKADGPLKSRAQTMLDALG